VLFFNDLSFLVRDAVKLVNQLVDCGVRRGNLALQIRSADLQVGIPPSVRVQADKRVWRPSGTVGPMGEVMSCLTALPRPREILRSRSK